MLICNDQTEKKLVSLLNANKCIAVNKRYFFKPPKRKIFSIEAIAFDSFQIVNNHK